MAQVVDEKAIVNAVAGLLATGGSTNHTLHIVAMARAAGLRLLNLTTPPVAAAEVYTAVTGRTDWRNELPRPPFDYDLHSRHAALLGGQGDYLCTRQQELDDICRFMAQTEG